MSRPDGFVVHEDDVEFEGWSDYSRELVRWRTLISGDRTPTESLTMGVAEVGPGTAQPHRHLQAEVYYILSGEGVVTVSGIEHPVRAGSAVFIAGGAEHCARSTSSGPLRLLYVFPAGSFSEIEYEFSSP